MSEQTNKRMNTLYLKEKAFERKRFIILVSFYIIINAIYNHSLRFCQEFRWNQIVEEESGEKDLKSFMYLFFSVLGDTNRR